MHASAPTRTFGLFSVPAQRRHSLGWRDGHGQNIRSTEAIRARQHHGIERLDHGDAAAERVGAVLDWDAAVDGEDDIGAADALVQHRAAQAQAHIAEPGLRRSAQLLAAEDGAGVRAAVGRAGEQFGLLEQADAAEQRGGEGFVFHRGEPDAAAFECLP